MLCSVEVFTGGGRGARYLFPSSQLMQEEDEEKKKTVGQVGQKGETTFKSHCKLEPSVE